MQPILSVILFLFGFLFVTTHYRLLVDNQQRTYREYLWIFGFKTGQEVPFDALQHIYLNRANKQVAYGVVGRVNASTFNYKAFIKLESGNSIWLGDNTSEQRLLDRVQTLSKDLGLEIKRNYD